MYYTPFIFSPFFVNKLPLSHTCPHEKSHAKQKDSEKLDMQAQPLTKLLVHWAMELAVILILTFHPSPKQNEPFHYKKHFALRGTITGSFAGHEVEPTS